MIRMQVQSGEQDQSRNNDSHSKRKILKEMWGPQWKMVINSLKLWAWSKSSSSRSYRRKKVIPIPTQHRSQNHRRCQATTRPSYRQHKSSSWSQHGSKLLTIPLSSGFTSHQRALMSWKWCSAQGSVIYALSSNLSNLAPFSLNFEHRINTHSWR